MGKFVYNVVKSNESTLLAETKARESITCSELLTLQYGLNLEIFYFLIPDQYVSNLFLISPKIHDKSVAATLVGHLAAPAIKRGFGGFL